MTDSDATFVFADIAGFTALTEAHGDEEAVALVAEFTEAVNAQLPPGAAHVKTIGDALMLRIPDPADAILLGLRITDAPMGGTARLRSGSDSITGRRSSGTATTSERRSTSPPACRRWRRAARSC